MIDSFKFCGLSQLGKKAGSMGISEYLRFVTNNYDKYLTGIKQQQEKPKQTIEDYDLYL